MKKDDFVKKLSEKMGVSKSEANKVFNAFTQTLTEVITSDLKEDENLIIQKLGTFKVKMSAERTSYNPQTKEKQVIPAKLKVVFSPASYVKEALVERK